MDKEILIKDLKNETIESMIYVIRGVKVMLDFELAKIYGYTTKAFNQQVQRNNDKLPDDFMFKLNEEEWNYILRSQIVTANNRTKARVTPFAFTEQGVYMLMTILKGELAIKQSISIIRIFKQMKDYIIESNNLITSNELLKLTNKVYETESNTNKNTKDIKDIKKKLSIVMDNFIDSKTYKRFVFFKGERIEADNAYQKIFSLAKHSIFVIDDYIDIKTLQLLKCVKSNIKIVFFSDNKNKTINRSILDDFKKDTNIELMFKENKIFHDRYIIIDYNYKKEMLFHLGTSIKDTGNSGSEINQIEDIDIYKEKISIMLGKN